MAKWFLKEKHHKTLYLDFLWAHISDPWRSNPNIWYVCLWRKFVTGIAVQKWTPSQPSSHERDPDLQLVWSFLFNPIPPFITPHFYGTGWGPQSIAFSWFLSGLTMVYGRYTELVNGDYFMVYKPTYNYGGAHPVIKCGKNLTFYHGFGGMGVVGPHFTRPTSCG